VWFGTERSNRVVSKALLLRRANTVDSVWRLTSGMC
jgi:hypothetical protein